MANCTQFVSLLPGLHPKSDASATATRSVSFEVALFGLLAAQLVLHQKRVLSHDWIIGFSPVTGWTRHGYRLGIGGGAQGVSREVGVGRARAGDGATDDARFH